MAEEFKPQYSFTDDRLNELKQLFPEAWEDGVFNVDTLRSLIGDYSTDNSVKEHFGLNWVGKQDARKIASKPPTGTLKPAPGEGVNEDKTENLFIEGDNLEVLKILRKSYIDKIKMIYIDPPYNTGNDFIYNDSFGDSTEDYLRKSGDKSEEGLLVSNPVSSGRFHANWLNFMYPRLRIAKDLLKNDGVIFITIDDNEIENLKNVCNEIFGQENFIGTIVWNSTKSVTNTALISVSHNYNLIYCKDINHFIKNREEFRLPESGDGFSNPDNDPRGPWKADPFQVGGWRPNQQYEIVNPNTGKTYLPNPNCSWKNDFKKYQELVAENRIVFGSSGDAGPQRKRFLSEALGRGKVSKTWWDDVGATTNGTKAVKKLFNGNSVFTNPKPVDLIEKMIQLGDSTQNGIILDFFSGSSTTAHAVMNLNAKDGGNRKFIQIQLPEIIDEKETAYKLGYRKISEVGKDRIRKVLTESTMNMTVQENKSKFGFRAFELCSTSIKRWKNFENQKDGLLPDLFSKLEAAFKNPLVEGTTPEEFITEVMLQEGFPLTANQTEVQDGIFKISHDWVPYTLYVSMLQSFKNIDLEALGLSETDHFVCLDMAFENNDALKQTLDNQCKLFTV